MKFPVIITLVFILFSKSAFANSEKDMIVTLADTLYGEVQVEIATNQISLRNGKNYQYLTASQVRWIRKNGRNYCVAAFGIESRFLIFEVLSKGSKSLLYREGVKFNPYDDEVFPPYFVLEDRSAFSVGTKREVLSVFGNHERKIKDFVKSRGLSFENKEDLSKIFNYYNEAN